MAAPPEAFHPFFRRVVDTVSFLRKPEILPQEEIVAITNRFSYTEPRYGILGESPQRRQELYQDSIDILALTMNNPGLLDPVNFDEWNISTPIYAMELLGMPLPHKIKPSDNPLQFLTPEQQLFSQTYDQWAKQSKIYYGDQTFRYAGNDVDINSIIRYFSRITPWKKAEHWPRLSLREQFTPVIPPVEFHGRIRETARARTIARGGDPTLEINES